MLAVYAIREHGDALEADLLEFFGVDLLDVWRRRLSLRRIGVLIKSLLRKPGRSTLLMEMEEATEWSTTDHLLARVSDALELSNYLFIKANSSENAEEIPVPESLPRPGKAEEAKKEPTPKYEFASSEEISNFFAQMNNL